MRYSFELKAVLIHRASFSRPPSLASSGAGNAPLPIGVAAAAGGGGGQGEGLLAAGSPAAFAKSGVSQTGCVEIRCAADPTAWTGPSPYPPPPTHSRQNQPKWSAPRANALGEGGQRTRAVARARHLQEVRPFTHRRAAFTLLEVLLTLSMSVVLMALIGGAIQFYGREMTQHDEEIRRVQLAASVMQMIEDDLRCALHGEPLDAAPLGELLSSAASGSQGSGGEAGDSSGDDTTSSATTNADDSSGLLTADAAALGLTSGAAVLQSPGLIGDQSQIQFDVSRLPRLEEYMVMMDASTANLDDVPSDIKTVAYYVQAAGATTGVSDPLASAGDSGNAAGAGGLVRRSIDRAAALQAATTGGLAQLNQTGKVLAPEITGIEFSYWDGVTWQLEWSSDGYGELPLAVKVELSMAGSNSAGSEAAADPSVRTFTHIVRLPLARPIDTTGTTTSGSGL